MDILGLGALGSGKVPEEVERERWTHCNGCTFLTKKNRCKKCGCFMNIKVKFKGAFCPIGIWGKENNG